MKKTLAIVLVTAAVTGCATGQPLGSPRVMDEDYACNYPFSCVNADAQIRELESQLKRATPIAAATDVKAIFDSFFNPDSREARTAQAIQSGRYKSCLLVNINALRDQCPGQKY